MQEIFQLLADYNARTNAELLAIVASKLPEEQAARDLGVYYGSVLGTLNHLAVSDVTWLRRFAGQFSELAPILPGLPALPELKPQTLKDRPWPTLAAFQPVRAAVDEAIREVFRLLPPEAYRATLQYRNIRGEEQRKIAWRAFLHLFNHQTHHRGQVAALLDQLAVENDCSNLISKY